MNRKEFFSIAPIGAVIAKNTVLKKDENPIPYVKVTKYDYICNWGNFDNSYLEEFHALPKKESGDLVLLCDNKKRVPSEAFYVEDITRIDSIKDNRFIDIICQRLPLLLRVY